MPEMERATPALHPAAAAARLVTLSSRRRAVAAQPADPSNETPPSASRGYPAATTDDAAAEAPPTSAPTAAPPLVDLRPLNGLRALCSAAVVSFHCWIIWSSLVPYELKAELTRHSWMVSAASVAGPLAVDAFLVLTGMLAAYQLLPLLEGAASCWRAVLGYWRRRALRLVPTYLAANALMALALPAARPDFRLARDFSFGQCHIARGFWLNLALLSHQRWAESCGELSG